eukprot:2253580-Amphidinium_carterae.2
MPATHIPKLLARWHELEVADTPGTRQPKESMRKAKKMSWDYLHWSPPALDGRGCETVESLAFDLAMPAAQLAALQEFKPVHSKSLFRLGRETNDETNTIQAAIDVMDLLH